MIEILQTAAIISIVAFATLCVLSGFVFLLALDKDRVAEDEKLVVTFFFNYWSKKNVVNSCKPKWVSLVLIMRLLVLASLCAIFLVAVIASFK